jgi:hypothetical protein
MTYLCVCPRMVYKCLCICCEPTHGTAYVLIYLCNLLNAAGLLQEIPHRHMRGKYSGKHSGRSRMYQSERHVEQV